MHVPFRVPIGVTLSVAPGGAVSVREVRWRDGRVFPIARSLPSGRVVDDDTPGGRPGLGGVGRAPQRA